MQDWELAERRLKIDDFSIEELAVSENEMRFFWMGLLHVFKDDERRSYILECLNDQVESTLGLEEPSWDLLMGRWNGDLCGITREMAGGRLLEVIKKLHD